MSTPTTETVWCLLVGPTRAVVGSEFYVRVQHTDLVADLAALIKKARPRALDNYDPGDCVVLRATDSCLTARDGPNINQKVAELYQSDKLQRVLACEEIGQLSPILGKEELLIIEFGCPVPQHECQGECSLPDVTISLLTFLGTHLGRLKSSDLLGKPRPLSDKKLQTIGMTRRMRSSLCTSDRGGMWWNP
jgi:hypothetical protein